MADNPVYSVEFWERSAQLAVIGCKVCEQCQCEAGMTERGRRIVRISLKVKGDYTPGNLALLCNFCSSTAERPRFPRKMAAEIVNDLFARADE